MGYLTVKFLGVEHQISESVKDFLQYDELLTTTRIKILQQLSQDIKRDSHDLTFIEMPNHVNNTKEAYIELMKECADVLVNKLFSLGIYDTTANELLSTTTAVSDINDLSLSTLQDMIDEGQKYVDMKERGLECAYRSAASNITGSGVMIFSNSITALMIHSVVESGILMSQAKQADLEYEEAVRAINTSTQNALDKMVSEVLLKRFYPSVMDILVNFNLKITSAFLVNLVEHNKFDFESVQDYNMQKAEEILTNIDRVPDKVTFLQQVFDVCPFSLNLYEVCLNNGLLDADTFKTAEYLGFADNLVEKMYEFIRANLQNKEQIEPIILILATYHNTTEATIWRNIYKDTILDIESTYQKYHSILSNKSILDSFIRDKISVHMIEVVNKSKEEIESIVNRIVSSTVTNERYEEFIQMGLISPEVLRLAESNATDLKTINSEISDKLVVSVMSFIEEAKRRLMIYQQSKAQFDSEMSIMQSELNRLKAEKDQLGFFAFSKKKELSSLIEGMENRIMEFEDKHESKMLLSDFERMYK